SARVALRWVMRIGRGGVAHLLGEDVVGRVRHAQHRAGRLHGPSITPPRVLIRRIVVMPASTPTPRRGVAASFKCRMSFALAPGARSWTLPTTRLPSSSSQLGPAK